VHSADILQSILRHNIDLLVKFSTTTNRILKGVPFSEIYPSAIVLY
jgi:hypothetical protein